MPLVVEHYGTSFEEKNGALLRFEFWVSGIVRMLSLNTCGGRNKWFSDCSPEGMETNG